MTADIEGLMAQAQSWERFDRILGKPFPPAQLTSVLDAARAQGDRSRQAAPSLAEAASDGTLIERRSAVRIPVINGSTVLRLPSGDIVTCSIKDISCGHAAVVVANRPPIGGAILLGKTQATVIRHTDDGFVAHWVPTLTRRARPQETGLPSFH